MNRLIAILFIIALFSCNNDEPALNPEPQPEKHYSLVGEWTWIESYCGWSGEHNPENTEDSLTLVFRRNGTFTIIENMDTVLSGDYLRFNRMSLMYGREIDFLNFICDSNFNNGFFTVDNMDLDQFVIMYLTDTLRLGADYFDGCGHSFKRVIK